MAITKEDAKQIVEGLLELRLRFLKELALDMCGAYGPDTDSMRKTVRESYTLLRKKNCKKAETSKGFEEMNTETIKIQDLEFSVSIEGTIRQPRNVSPTLLDEVRLQAAELFLSLKTLTKSQRDYWGAVRLVTPEPKRGRA